MSQRGKSEGCGGGEGREAAAWDLVVVSPTLSWEEMDKNSREGKSEVFIRII